jgi:electron transfer flavoprotein beta subunit
LQPLAIAKLLKAVTDKQQPQLIIMGKQAIDDDCNQTGQMLAGLLNWPQGTFVSKLIIKDNHAEVTREIDGGLETLLINLPAVITTDLRLNQPRFVTLPNIMRARSKSLEIILAEDFKINLQSHLMTKKVSPPPIRRQGVMVKDVKELLEKVKDLL